MFGAVVEESHHGPLGQGEVLELLLLQDAGVVDGIGKDSVRLGHLFLGERYLPQVVFALVRVVGQGVLQGLLG